MQVEFFFCCLGGNNEYDPGDRAYLAGNRTHQKEGGDKVTGKSMHWDLGFLKFQPPHTIAIVPSTVRMIIAVAQIINTEL